MTFPYLLSYMLRSYTLSSPVSGSKVLTLSPLWYLNPQMHRPYRGSFLLGRLSSPGMVSSWRMETLIPQSHPGSALSHDSPSSEVSPFLIFLLPYSGLVSTPYLQCSRPTTHGHATISNGHLSVLLVLGRSSFLSPCLVSMEASSCFSSCFVDIQLHLPNH